MLRDKRQEYLVALMLVGPFVLIYGALFVWPTIQMAMLSFTKAPLIGTGDWVGWDNYVKILSHKLFHQAFWNTAYFVLLTVIPNTLISLVIAMAVNRLKGPVQGFVLACFFLPYILPVSVVFLTWNWIIDVQYGLVQGVVALFNGGKPISLTRTIPLFMPTVAFVTIWWTMGFNILLFIAGLRNISPEIYDAARIDGVKPWQRLIFLTIPLLRPTLLFVLVADVSINFLLFAPIFMLTQGGPADSTNVLMYEAYKSGFVFGDMGRAMAIIVVVVAILLIVVGLQFKLLAGKEAR